MKRRISLFLAALLALMALPVLQALPAQGELAVSRLTSLTELPQGTRALAATGETIAIAGDSITILSRLAPDPINSITVGATSARLFTDIVTAGDRFFAVGIGESKTTLSSLPAANVINPDSITVPGSTETAQGLTRLVLLEFDAMGQVIKESIYESDLPLIPVSIKVFGDSIGIVGSVVSERGVQGFLATSDLALNFLSFNRYGDESTIIRSLASMRALYGSSSERLVGSNRQGITDGVILYLDASNSLTRVTRSYLASSQRSWDHVSASHLAVGAVKRSNGSEVAITKFSAQGAPQWFTRFPGSDGHLDLRTVGLITSKKLQGISKITPKGKNALFIEYASKGLNKRGSIARVTSIPAREIIDMADGYGVIVDRAGRFQLIPLAP